MTTAVVAVFLLVYAGMILAVAVTRDAREVIYVDVGGAGEP